MSRAIIHNSDYQSAEECMLTIDRYFDERNENFRARPKRAGKKIWGKEIVDPAFDEARTTAKIRDGKSEMRRAPTELDQVDFSHT